MTQGELRRTIDAKVWAAEFERHKKENCWTLDDIDEGLMISWFANAMMAAQDELTRKIKQCPQPST